MINQDNFLMVFIIFLRVMLALIQETADFINESKAKKSSGNDVTRTIG